MHHYYLLENSVNACFAAVNYCTAIDFYYCVSEISAFAALSNTC